MRKLILPVLAVVLLGPTYAHAEEIKSYEVDIYINRDSSMRVEESIEYDFGDGEKHGIFRDIPYKYKARGGNFNLRISDIQVVDEDGMQWEFDSSTGGGDLRLKIGDPDILISGVHTYRVIYTVKRALNYFGDYDELYWNAIGAEWMIPIRRAVVNVWFPGLETSEQGSLRYQCFTGTSNSTEEECAVSPNGDKLSFASRIELGDGAGLTIVAGWPKGITAEASVGQNILDSVIDNGVLALPLLVLAGLYYLWLKRGRDPRGRGVIVVEYDAPSGLSPAEVGTLVDKRFDNKDVSAQIIHLAVRGYIKIVREEKKVFFVKSTEYSFEKLKDGADLEDKFDRTLVQAIFSGSSSVALSEIKKNNLSGMLEGLKNIKKQVFESLIAKDLFPSNGTPTRVSIPYSVVGGILIVAGVFSGVIGAYVAVAVIVSGLMVIISGQFMAPRTAHGVEVRDHILGLKEYLEYAEKRRLEFHNAPEKNPERFEKLLPYAIALGVEEKWASQFQDLFAGQQYHPIWYVGSPTFNSADFSKSLAGFSGAFTASTSASGGSGFSGGGVGGGGGGGGGGSW